MVRIIGSMVKTTCVLMLFGIVVAGTNGCSVSLKHDALVSPAHSYTDSVATTRQANGIDGKVGWGRGTVFYIPFVPVYIEGKDGNEQVADQIRDALRQAGYTVAVVDALTSTTGPVLKCKVDEFWFNNYTWLFPFVPTWGDIKLTLSLEAPANGKTFWTRSFAGHGRSFNLFNGYTSAANTALTKVLNDMVQEFASEQFHSALTQA